MDGSRGRWPHDRGGRPRGGLCRRCLDQAFKGVAGGSAAGYGPGRGRAGGVGGAVGRCRAEGTGCKRLRFAFYGRVSSEDWQDTESSLARQLGQAEALVRGHGRIVARFSDVGESRTAASARSPAPASGSVPRWPPSHQQDRGIPAQAAKTELPRCERAGTRARACRPASVTVPQAATRRMPMHSRSAPYRTPEHAARAARPWPSVEKRRCTPTVQTPGRRPPCVRGQRDTTVHRDTR